MTQLELVLFISATIGCTAAYRLAATWWKRKNPRSEFLNEANVSHQLVWRVDPFVKAGSKMFIVAGDAHYSRDGAFKTNWAKSLTKWLNRGCEVHLLVTSDGETKTGLERLSSDHPTLFLHTNSNNEFPKHVAQKYKTFHPLLVQNGKLVDGKFVEIKNERAMWIENLHEDDSEIAYSVEFVVSPEVASAQYSRRFDEYKHDIDLMISSKVLRQ
jgi:hypothetical protein